MHELKVMVGERMKRFYYVADWGNERYLFVNNIMASVAAFWHNGFHNNKMTFAESMKRLFIDSGGYSMFSKYSDFPYTVEEYIGFVNQLRDKWPVTEVATMDYPCEPHVNREKYETNIARIDATIQNALECIDFDNSIPWVPVIQGYKLDEYKYCWQQYQDYGVSANLWAVGSVCIRKVTGGIRHIMTRIKRITKQNLHAFGLALPAIRHPDVFFSIFSSDSAAWNFMKMNVQSKIESIARYERELNQIFKGFDNQKRLEEFYDS